MFTIVVSRLKELEEQGGQVNPENPSEQSGLSACGASIGEIKFCIPEFRVVEFLAGIILGNAAGKDVYGLPSDSPPNRAGQRMWMTYASSVSLLLITYSLVGAKARSGLNAQR